MDPLDALVLLLILGAAYVLLRGWTMPSGVLDSFGAGFLPYRADDGWPHGVQEEEPRAWAWRARDVSRPDSLSPDPADEPEIVELGPAAAGPTLVRVAAGSASRRSPLDR